MSLLATLRRKGHEVRLDGLRVVVLLAPGADAGKAREWAGQHEQALRAELVSEAHRVVGLAREVYAGAKVREVRGNDGEPLRGLVSVIGHAEYCNAETPVT